MFRTLIYPSSGACDYSVELPHWSYCSWFDVCWSLDVVGLEWYPCCRLQPATRIPVQPNRNSSTHRTKNNTTNVVIQQNSCKLLMMDILMSETCWAHKKWNKIASDIKLVFVFNYYKDARSNKYKIHILCKHTTYTLFKHPIHFCGGTDYTFFRTYFDDAAKHWWLNLCHYSRYRIYSYIRPIKVWIF